MSRFYSVTTRTNSPYKAKPVIAFQLIAGYRKLIIGGETGIRTLGTVARTHAFQACPFDHSGISPHLYFIDNQIHNAAIHAALCDTIFTFSDNLSRRKTIITTRFPRASESLSTTTRPTWPASCSPREECAHREAPKPKNRLNQKRPPKQATCHHPPAPPRSPSGKRRCHYLYKRSHWPAFQPGRKAAADANAAPKAHPTTQNQYRRRLRRMSPRYMHHGRHTRVFSRQEQ